MENESTHTEGPEDRIAEILEGKIEEHTELEHQMVLAKELYEHLHGPFDVHNDEIRNQVMADWADSKCSKAFRILLKSEDFVNSGRSALSVTLSEVLKIAETLH